MMIMIIKREKKFVTLETHLFRAMSVLLTEKTQSKH